MNANPVNVTIRNLTRRTIRCLWLANGAKDIPAGQAVDVPYEPWSVADNGQRTMLSANLKEHKIALTLTVSTPDGNFTQVAYDPSAAPVAAVHRPAAAPARKADKPKVDDDNHTVIAGMSNVESLGLGGLRASVPKPKEFQQLDNSPKNELGFNVNGPVDADHAKVAGGEIKTASAEDADSETRDKFNALVAGKQWTDALQVLKNKFGDQVTFGVRVVMAMKDYDAIVSKYELK